MKDIELTHLIIGAAIEIHRTLGSGLLEAVYEECLAKEFSLRDIPYERQKPVPLIYKDLKLECGYCLDFLVNKRVVLEIKSIDAIAPVHESVMLTYLRLSQSPLGLVINFNVPILKDGIRRYVWHYNERTTQRRRATQSLAEKKEASPSMEHRDERR